jgi:mannosyltransferase
MGRKRLLLLCLALLLAFALRMVNLNGRPLWYDEAFAVLYASLSHDRMIYGTVTPVEGAGAADVHPLLYYFSLHSWMGVLGQSPFAARFFSVALGMLTVALLWRLAAWCFDRRTGLMVGLLAAVNPFHVAYSQEARMYALLGLAAVLAAWGLLRALEEERRRWWALYVVGAALTLYAHNLGAFVVLALNLLALARRRWRRRLPALLLADLAALALFGPWLVSVLPGQLGFVERAYWLSPPGVNEAVRALMLPVLSFYEPSLPWLLGLGLFVGLLSLVLIAMSAWRTRSRAGWFLLLCWAPVALLFLIAQWRPVYLERALLPSALFYLVAVGWLLARDGLPHFLRLGMSALLLVATAGALVGHYTYDRFPRPPFQAVNAFLRNEVGDGEIVVHDNKLTFFPAYYYDPKLPQVFCPDLPGAGSDTLAWPTQEALGLFAVPITDTLRRDGVAGVWYVVFEQTFREYRVLGSEDAPNRAALRAHCEHEEEPVRFNDLLVYHFSRCEVR